MRMRLAECVFVDVYNMHTDTGDQDEADGPTSCRLLRQSTPAQLGTLLSLWETQTAGVNNRALDNIAKLTNKAGLTDTWIQLVRGSLGAPTAGDAIVRDDFNPTNSCEVVDKTFYMGSPPKFTNATGARLSDHFPISATFTWSNAATPARLSDFYVGPHGDWFSDLTGSVSKSTVVTNFTIAGEKRIDSVTVVRKSSTSAASETLNHGGNGGTASTLTLNGNEHVVQTLCARANSTT
ncbi:hypothetical protein BJ742DRAFT_889088 [Cladochytrium replicatum]|nr:hypothetical protein BJ742DRAFT_889088 [Cladochytrium replicatum]